MVKLSLREAIRHSNLVETIDVGGVFSFCIRPWAPCQLDELKPLVVRIFKEFKKQKGGEEIDALDAVISILEQDEYIADVYKIVYETIAHANEKIKYTVGGEPQESEIWDFAEFHDDFPLPVLFQAIRVIWEQNFAKNLFTGSAAKEKEQPTEEDAKAVLRKVEEAAPRSR